VNLKYSGLNCQGRAICHKIPNLVAVKMLAAILLFAIFLFNWVGYRVLNEFMDGEASERLESRIDHRLYDVAQLISVKIPVTQLSYYNNSNLFERVNGQIEINGMPYQYVQRRIFNDSLEILCLPNQLALQLRRSGDEYFKLVNDIQRSTGSRPGSRSGSSRSFFADPYTITHLFQIEERAFTSILRPHPSSTRIRTVFLSADERPPTVLS
jgi:hypothetical protein